MRRSNRERKAVDHFKPAEPLSLDETSESETVDSEGSVQSSKHVPVSKKKGIGSNDPVSKQSTTGDHNILFAGVSQSKSISAVVDKFITNYSRDRIASMAELLNFVLLVKRVLFSVSNPVLNLFQSAGSGKSWIRSSIDVDGLNAEELDELLSDATMAIASKKSVVYPLSITTKTTTFRCNFVKFWELLAIKIMSHNDRARMLSTTMELLIGLSSISTPSIRHSVTEGAMSVGRVLLKNMVDVSKKISELERQVRAGGVAGGNKLKAIETMLKDSQKLYKALEDHVSTIFKSIFVHRYKDSNEAVRARAAWHLSEWMISDPERYYDDDFLKYIGWMCSDRSALVRREAIGAVSKLLTKPVHIPRLLNFTERFIDRFIEMAVGDTDEPVSFDTVKMLRSMQICGLLDTLDQGKLDNIDNIVFDVSASARVRAEVLAFVMDHTEGFEDDATNGEATVEGDATSRSSKARKSGSGAGASKRRAGEDEMALLTRRKRIAGQLETFLEFAELHLMHLNQSGGSLDLLVLLADACLSIPSRSGIVKDWEVFILLLLRESSLVLDTDPLSPDHVAILLRLFVASAMRVQQWHISQFEDSRKKNPLVEGLHINRGDWESLQDHILSSIPQLLTRFRGEDECIEQLIDLLGCCEPPSGAGSKIMQSLVKVATDMFENCQQEQALSRLAGVFRNWLMAAEYVHDSRKRSTGKGATKPAYGFVKGVIGKLLSGVFDKWKTGINALIKESEALQSGSTGSSMGGGSSKKKRDSKSMGSTEAQQNLKNSLFGAAAAANKYSALWTCIDCRDIVNESTSDICEEMSSLLTPLYTMLENGHFLSTNDASLLTGMIRMSGRAMWSMLLWNTREVYVTTRDRCESSAGDGDSVEAVAGDVEGLIDTILSTREHFLDTLSAWMDCGATGPLSGNCAVPVSQLQCEAFRMIGDVRMAFPLKETEYETVKRLAWSPPMELLQKMERVFTAEDHRIKSTLAELGDSEKDALLSEQLSRQLVENLLCPLGGSMYDIEHLNRRQAAALMGYIVDPSNEVQKVVKVWIKTLKDQNIGKYLETILVALKKSYEERIRPLLVQHKEAVEQFGRDEDNEEEGHEDYPTLLQEEAAALVLFAQKLAQSLGVGKAKGQTKDFLVLFFKVGITYGLQEIDNAGFLILLEPFLKLLGDAESTQVLSAYEEAYESAPVELRHLCDEGAGNWGDSGEYVDERVIYAMCVGAVNAFAGKLGFVNHTNASMVASSKRAGGSKPKDMVDMDDVSPPLPPSPDFSLSPIKPSMHVNKPKAVAKSKVSSTTPAPIPSREVSNKRKDEKVVDTYTSNKRRRKELVDVESLETSPASQEEENESDEKEEIMKLVGKGKRGVKKSNEKKKAKGEKTHAAVSSSRRSSRGGGSAKVNYAEDTDEEVDDEDEMEADDLMLISQSQRSAGRMSTQSSISDITMDDDTSFQTGEQYGKLSFPGKSARAGSQSRPPVSASAAYGAASRGLTGKSYGSNTLTSVVSQSAGASTKTVNGAGQKGRNLKGDDIVMGLHIEDDFYDQAADVGAPRASSKLSSKPNNKLTSKSASKPLGRVETQTQSQSQRSGRSLSMGSGSYRFSSVDEEDVDQGGFESDSIEISPIDKRAEDFFEGLDSLPTTRRR